MTPLFSPALPEYEEYRLFHSFDGSVSRWGAARSMEEAVALFRHNGVSAPMWTKEVLDVRGEFFVLRPSPAIAFMRFSQGELGGPRACVLSADPGGLAERSADLPQRCGRCDACEVERTGCACDGAYDDGCFLCSPDRHGRPLCPPPVGPP